MLITILAGEICRTKYASPARKEESGPGGARHNDPFSLMNKVHLPTHSTRIEAGRRGRINHQSGNAPTSWLMTYLHICIVSKNP